MFGIESIAQFGLGQPPERAIVIEAQWSLYAPGAPVAEWLFFYQLLFLVIENLVPFRTIAGEREVVSFEYDFDAFVTYIGGGRTEVMGILFEHPTVLFCPDTCGAESCEEDQYRQEGFPVGHSTIPPGNSILAKVEELWGLFAAFANCW